MKLSTINKFALVCIASKPLRTVLRWQVYAAAALTLAAGWWAGMPGAISALLGGLINILAGLVYAMMVSGNKARSAGQTLRTLVRAEASKIVLIVLQLWIVLTTYHDVVVTAFFAAFVISVLIFPMALLVRD
jgi:ATP synthase protein I